MCVVHGVLEFLAEVANCLNSLVTFIWRVSVLFYHVVSVVVNVLENLVCLMWTGSIGTMTMVSTSIEVLKKSWASTWQKGEAFINKLFILIIGGFETIGSVFIELALAAFNILFYSFLGIPRGIIYTCDYCIDFITYNMNRLQVKLYSFSKESFLGLSMCILLLAMFFNSVQIMTFLDSQGMTFPFFRSRQTREQNHPFRNFDGGYNFEFSDNEPMDDDDDDGEDGDDDYDEEDRVTVTTTRSDTSVHDSETESLSASSPSISSEETSESDIEIQLPSSSNRSNPGSQSPTKPMDSDYVEKELERERDKRKCVVCQDRMKTVLILPCRHMCLCVPCAEHIVQISSAYRRLCPLCRVRIEKVMNVYV